MSLKNVIRVLYIDDEEKNLQGFHANYRRDFYVKTAISAEIGREMLKNDWFHVIIADHHMPMENGVEFLSKCAVSYPKPIRILMTAYTDVKTIISSINEGKIFKYIGKPAPDDFVEFAIKEAFQLYDVQEKLEIKNKELEKTNEELDKFIYSASHDLRAPLLSILGITDLAKNDTANIPRYLDIIEKSAKKLDEFILNLVNYYKNTKLEVFPKHFDLSQLANESFENVLYFDGAGEIDFQVIMKSEQTQFVTDKTKLAIIFNNLVTNCIRYRDKTKAKQYIRFEIEITENQAKIVVADNGIGIEKGNLKKIFTMFYKVSKNSQGSGIGMYIVKDAIEKLNGSLEVDSEVGVGTNFVITIPQMAAKES